MSVKMRMEYQDDHGVHITIWHLQTVDSTTKKQSEMSDQYPEVFLARNEDVRLPLTITVFIKHKGIKNIKDIIRFKERLVQNSMES